MSYETFLRDKAQANNDAGFEPVSLPGYLIDFQRSLVEWATMKGRSAIYADCGLGKTVQQLVWADNVVRKTNRPVLVLTPLGVAAQTVREGEKFGIEAVRTQDASSPRVIVSNYERLHHYNAPDFAGVVCDESSILKNFDGSRKAEVTAFMRKLDYRLLCTATAAPNDYVELGTSSEALGHLGYMDMLGRFFRNQHSSTSSRGNRVFGKQNEWRFKGHAEEPFWRWVCSWARAVRKPSDLGFDDARFRLPPLTEREQVVAARSAPPGSLFNLPAVGLYEQREELRRTLKERCARVADLVAHDQPALVWCHLNEEGDTLERSIPGAIQVSGADSDEEKEEKLLAFASGQARVLVSKPKVAGLGLNFQHCAHVTFFPSHSFEQYYQSVRRCWRFGQTREVVVDVVTTEGQRNVLANLQRKAKAAETMFARLVEHMKSSVGISTLTRFPSKERMPEWL